jgi:hypothetical protein
VHRVPRPGHSGIALTISEVPFTCHSASVNRPPARLAS